LNLDGAQDFPRLHRHRISLLRCHFPGAYRLQGSPQRIFKADR
jgi:hypothetical protein